MAKTTKSSRSSSGSFTLGRANFSKISAVEGIRLDRNTAKTFGDFEAKGLSHKARREALTGKFVTKR